MFGFMFELDNKLYIKSDYSEYVRVENRIAHINLPETVKPISSINILKILYVDFNPSLVYRGNVYETIKGWEYLESEGINLGHATNILATYEIGVHLEKGFLSATPSIISPAKLSFLIYFLRERKVKNIETKVSEIRRKIGSFNKGAVKRVNKDLIKGVSPVIAAKPLLDSLYSIISELVICRELVEQGYDVMFNPQKNGPDLYINGKSVKLEVTKKEDSLNIEEYKILTKIAQENNDAIISVDDRAILITLSLLLADKLDDEFRQGEIVAVDLSSVFEGTILLASKSLSEKPNELELKYAVDKALVLANEGKQSIIFYSASGNTSSYKCFDAETILCFTNFFKKNSRGLISLRKKYPYTSNKLFGNIFKSLDKPI